MWSWTKWRKAHTYARREREEEAYKEDEEGEGEGAVEGEEEAEGEEEGEEEKVAERRRRLMSWRRRELSSIEHVAINPSYISYPF